ncbi:divalent-cation tolerance protein CutA [Magnetospirillum sulfuroxidans]|uniref:Divalent-cation tolerance protein CutA n=1 Tax=Magnetospirillum sulfuroxidans TaxID=611300 RepID=A0ABS5I7Y5_9PROT|nr:divalent-cation tolerance protein CutA [Magnetospirillum sulfuroxidans]MBR9970544.1 divalent-cation tolerance protein CutA [Magnetospirillum sulfuroxidans]
MTDQARLIYLTAPDRATAEGLARTIVGERLAACANILGPITSVYWWDGKINEEGEIALLFKTMASNVPALTDRIRQMHPYECPCIVALPLEGGNPDFLAWIAAEIRPATIPTR